MASSDRNDGDEDWVCSGRQPFKLAGLMKSDGITIDISALVFERNRGHGEPTTVTYP
jgi:hypothetical protein